MSTSGMKFSPTLPGHKIIGGVFMTYYPMLDTCEPPVSIWDWNTKSEKILLTKIFNLLEQEWRGIENKEHLGSLMLSGIGISHSDLPALSAKLNEHSVSSPKRIYDVLYGCRQIDLSVATFCQFGFNNAYFAYPKPKSALYQKYLNGKTMLSGTSVWDLYESKRYSEIEARTLDEVNDCFLIYKSMFDLKKKNDSSLKRLIKLDKARESESEIIDLENKAA